MNLLFKAFFTLVFFTTLVSLSGCCVVVFFVDYNIFLDDRSYLSKKLIQMILSLGAFQNFVYCVFFLHKNPLVIVNVSILFATVPFTFAE